MVAFEAINVPAEKYGAFKNAVNSGDKGAAKSACDAFEKSVLNVKKELAETSAHPWKSAQESDAAVKALLEVEETTAIPEMKKILALIEEGKAGEDQQKQIAASLDKINGAVLKKIDAATDVSKQLQAEIGKHGK